MTEKLAVNGKGHDIENKEDSVLNAVAFAHNAAMFITSKVKGNALQMMSTPVILPQYAVPSNPTANSQHTLLKVPNALVIQQVQMLSRKLNAARPLPKLAEAQSHQQQ